MLKVVTNVPVKETFDLIINDIFNNPYLFSLKSTIAYFVNYFKHALLRIHFTTTLVTFRYKMTVCLRGWFEARFYVFVNV